MSLAFSGPIKLFFWLSASPFPALAPPPAARQRLPFLHGEELTQQVFVGCLPQARPCQGWRHSQEKGPNSDHPATHNHGGRWIYLSTRSIILGVCGRAPSSRPMVMWPIKSMDLGVMLLVTSGLLVGFSGFSSLGSVVQFMFVVWSILPEKWFSWDDL